MTVDLGPLLKPLQCKSLKLRNRVAMAPMTRSFSPNNVPGEDVAGYYRRRAEGGVGLLITEGVMIPHPAANANNDVPALYGEEALSGWRRVVEQVHAAGGAIIPQLWHVGSVRREGVHPNPEIGGYSPSGLYKPDRTNGRAMSRDDVHEMIQAYATAARNAKQLGFDGVELHGAHGYLIDQFLWEGTNQRDDEYGGSFENRLRFPCEVVKAVRAEVGPDFAIVFRYSQWKQQDYEAKLAPTPQELERLLIPLAEAGVDIFHASTRRFWEPEFADSDLNLAGWTRKITGLPTISVGSVGLNDEFIMGTFQARGEGRVESANLDNLIERMSRDEFDLVAVGRALLQDPYWFDKLRTGRSEEIEPFRKAALETLS